MSGRGAARGWHVPEAVLERFATLDGPSAGPGVAWSVETHLECCPDCRAALTRLLAVHAPETFTLVEEVRDRLDARLAAAPAAAASPQPGRRITRRVAGGLLISRLAACVAVLFAAVLLDSIAASGSDSPSWVLLVAPILPLAGVAASWSSVLDPAHGLVAATPAAGLPLLLRRTLVVLAVVMAASLLAAAVTGVGGQAAWLLPCVALTSAALALGGVVGIVRATCAVGAAWAIAVVAPALAAQAVPAPLEPSWLPAWTALTVLAAGVVAVRRNAYRRMLGG